MTTPTPSSCQDTFDLTQALKQFFLETDRLEMAYRQLQGKFHAIHQTLQETNIRMEGKLSELDFTSRYLGTILDHISQGILFIDLNGIVTTYNAAAQELLKIPEKKLLFHPFHDYFDDTFLGFSLKEVFQKKAAPPTLIVSQKEEGDIHEWEVEATFVAMSDQAYPLAHRQASEHPIQGLLVLLRNVTQIRRLQRLANHQDRLKDLGELAAHLAHEIRNPLGGIKGFATILREELKERADLEQMAGYIVQGADELNRFVSNILLYARPFRLHLEQIDIVALINEVKQLMEVDPLWNDNIKFCVKSVKESLVLPLDAQHMKSALLNIFVNAVQAMPDGGELRVQITEEKASITVVIEDTGIGIPPENLSKLFSPFFTTKEAGNGLGLAEVHKVIQEHQGSMGVESEVGKGTKFTIKLRKKGDGD